jgi:uncharacterized protein YacL (UPF0231 family)
LITGSGKIVSSTSVEHVIHDDYLQEDIKKQIDDFNQKLEDALDDANFQVDGDGKYTSMYLNDIECPDDTNSGMAQEEENVPSLEEYDDMVMEECPRIPSKNLGIPKIGDKKVPIKPDSILHL